MHCIADDDDDDDHDDKLTVYTKFNLLLIHTIMHSAYPAGMNSF